MKLTRKLLNYSIAIIISFCCICLVLAIAVNSSGSNLSTPTPIQVLAPLPISTLIALTYSAARTQTATYNPTPLSTGTSVFTPTITMAPASTANLETMNALATFYQSNPIFTPIIYPTSDGIIVNPPGGGNNNNFDSNGDGKVTCADFQTQAAAQRAYNAGYKNLDGNDNDGKACESLP